MQTSLNFLPPKKDSKPALNNSRKRSIISRLSFSMRKRKMKNTLKNKKRISKQKELKNQDMRTRTFNSRSSETKRMFSKSNCNNSKQRNSNKEGRFVF